MKILSLNCQRGYQSGLEAFLRSTLDEERYDFLLLQEVEQKVLPFLDHAHYALARAYNAEAEEDAQLCIVYRREYRLLRKEFQSFALMRNDPHRGFKHPSFGFLWGDFDIHGEAWRMGSSHLHSGMDRRARAAELALVKKLLIEQRPIPTVFCGDFNAGYPRESAAMSKLLAPEFVCTTKGLGPTLDSRYTEHAPHLPNRVAKFLARFNVRIPLWTDKIFVDATTAASYPSECRILPDRISDHSPVELVFDQVASAISSPALSAVL
jgi:endonuclease/exonuclease/phosphatase family metal-dependent hydrolase